MSQRRDSKWTTGLGLLVGALVVAVVAAARCANVGKAPDEIAVYDTPRPLSSLTEHVDGMLAPLPEAEEPPDARVELGAKLFSDPKVSGDGMVSCVTCHNLALGGANGQYRTNLPGRGPVPVNVPTVFNLAYDFRFTWSGKFRDLGESMDVAMQSKDVMATNWQEAAQKLASESEYNQRFRSVYADGVTAGNLRDALARYCVSLVTPHALFDEFLRGRATLSEPQTRGYVMFREYGCVSCHQGVNVGGNMYQRFGVMRDYFAGRTKITNADLGLYVLTKREEDKHVFRVPSLRNVALTAPYFHDGSAATLADAVQIMARHQLGRELTREQTSDIVAFLETLTGKQPKGTP